MVMTEEQQTVEVQAAAWEAAPYVQFSVPQVPYSAIRVPLVADPQEAAAWVDRALKVASYLQRHYAALFPQEEPHYEPFPEPQQRPQQAPQQQAAGQAPVCNLHNKPMKPSKFGGGWYCASKLADGTYCQEKAA